MKTTATRIPLLCAVVLLLAAGPAAAQNIYKCTEGGQVAYTDHPCPGGNGELLHQADDGEIIDQYLRLGQDGLAKQYADAHHLDALYQQRVDAYQQAQDEKARREAEQQADEAAAAQAREEAARQQAALDDAANRGRLQAENEALRQQNEAYQEQLAQPVYSAPPAYWGALPGRGYRDRDRNHHRDHDQDHGDNHQRPHRPPASKPPPVRPCTGGLAHC